MPGLSYDRPLFGALLERLRSGTLGDEANRVTYGLRPPSEPPVVLAELGEAKRARLVEAGEGALARGEVGIVVLAGGAATRFGGGAKAVVAIDPAHPRLSLVAVKLADARRRSAKAAAIVMTSFATHETIEAHLAELDWHGVEPDRRFALQQSVMPRVTLDGTPLTEIAEACASGEKATFAPTGHGDLLGLLHRTGTVERLRALGARHLLVSNVDNLGATLDPLMVGAHIEGGKSLTAEAIPRRPGDAGASVCEREDGRLVLIEDPRLPATTDPFSFQFFSVNNLWIRVDAIDKRVELDWCAVRKRVAELDREVIQLERFVNQMSEFVDAGYVVVDEGRFLPVKTRDDLSRARAQLLDSARAAGLIDPAELDSMEGEST